MSNRHMTAQYCKNRVGPVLAAHHLDRNKGSVRFEFNLTLVHRAGFVFYNLRVFWFCGLVMVGNISNIG